MLALHTDNSILYDPPKTPLGAAPKHKARSNPQALLSVAQPLTKQLK